MSDTEKRKLADLLVGLLLANLSLEAFTDSSGSERTYFTAYQENIVRQWVLAEAPLKDSLRLTLAQARELRGRLLEARKKLHQLEKTLRVYKNSTTTRILTMTLRNSTRG